MTAITLDFFLDSILHIQIIKEKKSFFQGKTLSLHLKHFPLELALFSIRVEKNNGLIFEAKYS